MSVVETVLEAGSPALKVVDLRVNVLENTVEDHTKELQRHVAAIDGIGLEVKKVGDEMHKMIVILSKIKTLMIGGITAVILMTAYQEGVGAGALKALKLLLV